MSPKQVQNHLCYCEEIRCDCLQYKYTLDDLEAWLEERDPVEVERIDAFAREVAENPLLFAFGAMLANLRLNG